MKLSEAIRIGSVSSKQGFRQYHDSWGDYRCALGAAYYAVRGHALVSPQNLHAAFPVLNERLPPNFQCPANAFCLPPRSGFYTLFGIIITHLNDYHKWDRLRIADWVASFEKSLESDVCALESDVCAVESATTKEPELCSV